MEYERIHKVQVSIPIYGFWLVLADTDEFLKTQKIHCRLVNLIAFRLGVDG